MKAKLFFRRIGAFLLCFVLVTSLLPAGALAADDGALGQSVPRESGCLCTAPCVAEAMNDACLVCGAEGAGPEDCTLYQEPATESEENGELQDDEAVGSTQEPGDPTPSEGGKTEGNTTPAESDELAPLPPENNEIDSPETASNVTYIDESGGEDTCDSATVVTSNDAAWGTNDDSNHWYVVNSDTTISERITVTGNVHLILTDGYSLTVKGGINVTTGNSLTIYAQSTAEDAMGKLTATVESDDYESENDAAIGGNREQYAGTITINGGVVVAQGGRFGAGIGTGDIFNYDETCNTTITINGGIVTAGCGYEYGTGIGARTYSHDGGTVTVTITDGTVVTSNIQTQNGVITISGGAVTVKDSIDGTLSTGNNGTAIIYAGRIWSNDGAGDWSGIIFQGSNGQVYGNQTLLADMTIDTDMIFTIPEDITLNVPNGLVLTNKGTIINRGSITNDGAIDSDGTIDNSGTITNTGVIGNDGTISNSGEIVNSGTIANNGTIFSDADIPGIDNVLVFPFQNVQYIDELGNSNTQNGVIPVMTGSTVWGAEESDTEHWYVALGSITISSRVTVQGNVHLILADGCSLTVNGGINVPQSGSLTIYAQSDGDEMGILTANGSYGDAGIGGTSSELDFGTITINGGGIKATGSNRAAGIGGGGNANNHQTLIGKIIINDGTVTATGGDYASGIGGGADSNGTHIEIHGGTVSASGGRGSSSVGAGYGGSGTTVEITGGVVKATGGEFQRIGDSTYGDGGSVSISGNAVVFTEIIQIGGTEYRDQSSLISENYNGIIFLGNAGQVYGDVVPGEDFEIPQDYTLTIPEGTSLTVSNGVTLTNNGTITNSNGTFINEGTINNNGTLPENIAGDVRYPSTVTVTVSKNNIVYGETVTITATMQKTESEGINALADTGHVNFYLGNSTDETLLGTADVQSTSNSTYNATLLIESATWTPGTYTITADFGGVTGDASSGGLVSNTGTASITVAKANPPAGPDAPTMASRTINSITLVAISDAGYGDVEYGYVRAFEGTPSSWQTGITFNNLNAGTSYTFYARYAGNDCYNMSASGTGTTITTLGAEGGDTLVDGETITTSDGTTITKDGDKITITPSDGKTTTITPANDVTVNTGENTVNIPSGTTVQTGDSPEMTLPQGGIVEPSTGAVTPNDGGTVQVGDTTITLPAGGNVTPDEDGAVIIPSGSTVQTGTGSSITINDDTTNATVNGAGDIMLPGNGSVIVGQGESFTTVTVPENGGTITTDSDGSVTIPGGSTVTDSQGNTTTIPENGGTIQPDGGVSYSVTITFDSQGGSSVDSQAVECGTAVAQPAAPTRNGYTFQGWYTEASGGEQWIFTQPVTANMTLYAHWSLNTSGHSISAYRPDVADTDNGDVTVSPSLPKQGQTVTITPTPDKGYEVEDVTVTDRNGNEVNVTENGNGNWSFIQPGGTVTIEVTFQIIQEPELTSLPFTDVPAGSWYESAVQFVYENGLMIGIGANIFEPNGTTTRAQIVTILWRLEGNPVANYLMGFDDVASGAWYTDAVRWAASEGIVGGYGNGLFGADDAVSREQLAAILYRYAVYKGYDVSIGEDTNILSYADFDQLSDYAIPAMQWACGAGIVNGTSESTLSSQGEATRAQVAAMLQRFSENIVQ